MITYKWTISALDCKVDVDGLNNVVTTVHWRYRGTDEDGVTAETYGAQAVGEPNPDAFIPYPELKEEEVTQWLEEDMDMEAIRESIDSQIELIKNPIQVTLPAPWNIIEEEQPEIEEEVEEEEINEEEDLDTEE